MVEKVCRNPECGKAFRQLPRAAGFCSRACWGASQRGERRAVWDNSPRRCEGCHVEYVPTFADQRFHDRECADKHRWGTDEERKQARRNRQRRFDMARKAAQASIACEPYTTAEIALRDGYMCGLCDEPVDMSVLYPDDRCATIDHVVPLRPRPGEPQGDDVPSNVQLAHRDCNQAKGNRQPPGDMIERVVLRQTAWEEANLSVNAARYGNA